MPSASAPRSRLLDAEQAAARLGIKKATLYAYVSRGLLQRELSLDGRTSLFDPAEVERVRRDRGRRNADSAVTIVTSITEVTPEGHRYRGRPVADFVAEKARFESVADWLWQDEAPWELDRWTADAPWPLDAPPPGLPALAPSASMLHRFGLAVTLAGAADPLRATMDRARFARCGRLMLSAMVASLPVLGRAQGGSHTSRAAGADASTLARALWPRISPEAPEQARVDALNAVLVVLADHGLATSTYAVRVATSVRSDPYAIVQAGLGAVAGIHHGAAAGQALRLIERSAAVGPAAAVAEVLEAGGRVPGLGHSIYRDHDPRHGLLAPLIAEAWRSDPRLGLLEDLEALVTAEVPHPVNVDFSLASLLWLARADADAGYLFALARVAGWLAHAMEELDERPVRFRVKGRYVPTRGPLPEDA